MRAHITFAIAVATCATATVSGCGSGPVEQRCNSDLDCPSRACFNGACRDRDELAAFLDGHGDVDVETNEVAAIDCDTGVVVFADGDLDGVGAGAPSCAPSIDFGFAATGDDCDDADASAFALATVYDDGDGDGYTAGTHVACVGATERAGERFAPNDAPINMVDPYTAEPIEGFWDDAHVFYPSPDAEVGVVDLSSFACAQLPERVSGVRVELTLFNLVAQGETPVAIGMQLQSWDDNGAFASSAEYVGEYQLPQSGMAFDIGGPGDTLGLALTPELLCDEDTTVRLTVDAGDAPDAIFWVAATILVYGAEDCDDANVDAFSPARLHDDADHDGAGAGPSSSACVGIGIPLGKGVRDSDCAPEDADAFPGQTSLFERERIGVGGFDFNCDAVEEKLDEDVEDISQCFVIGGGCSASYSNVLSPSCGASVDVGDCSNSCALDQLTYTQACR